MPRCSAAKRYVFVSCHRCCFLRQASLQALRLAREVADEGGAMVAGNICNSTMYTMDDDAATKAIISAMFEEQVGWAADAGVDLIIGEVIFT